MMRRISTSSVLLTVVTLLSVPAAARVQDPAKVAQGVKLYAAEKCDKCHSIEGKGAKKGPLDGVATKLSEEEIRQWLVDPVTMAKKTKSTRKPPMKPVKLAKDDIEALVVYMQTLKKKG